MFCTNCGAQVDDGCKFCTSCGTKIEVDESFTASAAEPTPVAGAPTGQPTPSPAPQYNANAQGYNPNQQSAYTASQQQAYGQAQTGYIPVMYGQDSYFDGSGGTLFGLILLTTLVSMVTCGFATPWMLCKIYKWRIEHTVINGKRLTFTGNGGSLFGHYLLWGLLTIITCGIYSFFMVVALRKWELERTFFEGEPIIPDAKVSTFDGKGLEFIGYSLLTSLIIGVSCGIATPWAICILQKWDTKHQVINGRRLEFDGQGGQFFGQYLLICLLSVITCGIYSAWGTVKLNKFIIEHTHFSMVNY